MVLVALVVVVLVELVVLDVLVEVLVEDVLVLVLVEYVKLSSSAYIELNSDILREFSYDNTALLGGGTSSKYNSTKHCNIISNRLNYCSVTW